MYGVAKFIKRKRKERKRERLLRDKQASYGTIRTKEDVPDTGHSDGGEVAGVTNPIRDRDKE